MVSMDAFHAKKVATDADYAKVVEQLEIEELRGACMALSEALAKRVLIEVNATLDDPHQWPGGQTWDELVGTSHSILRHRAWEEAQLDVKAMIALLFDRYGHPKPYAGQE